MWQWNPKPASVSLVTRGNPRKRSSSQWLALAYASQQLQFAARLLQIRALSSTCGTQLNACPCESMAKFSLHASVGLSPNHLPKREACLGKRNVCAGAASSAHEANIILSTEPVALRQAAPRIPVSHQFPRGHPPSTFAPELLPSPFHRCLIPECRST